MRELKFNEIETVIGGALGADLAGLDLLPTTTVPLAPETVWTRVLRDLGLGAADGARS
ncbi:MAG: hypothetical protein ABI411_10770 [Tahibacter sp.]